MSATSLRSLLAIAAAALGLVLPMCPCSAQCQPVWQATPTGTATTEISGGVVYAAQPWTPSGQNTRVVIGGSFTTCSGVSGYNHIAMWDGTSWSSVGAGGIDGFVYSLAVFNGELIAAGQFSTAGGVACNNIAAFNGTNWHTLGAGINGAAFAMTNANGILYVGGNLTSAGGVAASHLASWNGSSWAAAGSGTDQPIHSMCFENPGIIVGGAFTTAGGSAASHIARWTGSAWQTLGAGVAADVLCLTKYNNQIYAGGTFADCNGTTTLCFEVARWNGSTWSPLGPGGSQVGLISAHASPRCDSFCIYNNILYIGGLFDYAGGSPASGIVSWDGSTFTTVGAGIGPPTGEPFAMCNFQSCLMAFGSFNEAGGSYAPEAARWNGTEWSKLECQPSGNVLSLAVVNGGLIAGGAFNFQTSLGTIARNVVTYGSGTTVAAFQNLGGFTGPNGPVYAVAPLNPFSPVQPQSTLIAGSFTQAGGVNASNIAQISFVSEYSALGAGLNNSVTCVRQFNQTVYAGGAFTGSGATPINHIAKYTSGGWIPAGTSGVAGGTPSTLTIYNGNLYMGGDFTSVDGLDTGGISRWDGTSWHVMGGHFGGTVLAMTVFNNQLIIAGSFPGTQGSPNIATWDGTNYTGIGTGLGSFSNGFVTALAVHNNELYAAGSFAMPGVPTLVDVAKWNGTSWVAVDTSIPLGTIGTLQSFSGALWAGGGFYNPGGHFQPFISKLACACYANCDNSGVAPLLNANDFQCFLNAFASGDMYANCDGSAVIPYLNANDFQCFLNAFASGCQ